MNSCSRGRLLLLVLLLQVSAECPKHCKCSRYHHFVRCNNASMTDVPHLPSGLQVTVMDLSQNNITILKNSTFQAKNIINVSVLKLFENNLTTVDSDAFLGLSDHLLDLQLRDNPNIKLPEVGFHLETLLFLDLSFCNLENIPLRFFQRMPDISSLYLRGNKLSFFDPDIIKPGKGLDLSYLSLDDNQFTKLQLRLVIYQKANLWMDGNPFHCDCDFYLAYTVYSQRHLPTYAQLVCATPARLHGVSGAELLKMNLGCDQSRKLQDDVSWWYRHQWWLLLVCASGVLLAAITLHLVFKNKTRGQVLERLWISRKFTTFQNNLNESENVLMD